MTPPDSAAAHGQCADPDCGFPHKLDSDAREVCECGFPKPPREGHFTLDNVGEFCWVGAPGSLAVVHMGALPDTAPPKRSVLLPLPLAQRILAALDMSDATLDANRIRALASELRDRLPK